jgi:LacI family transcriptional regulator
MTMLGRRVTLRDVADRAGVHTSTASRAINEHTRSLVDSQTVERVLLAAKELGYRPNSLARGLKTNRTFTVGMLLPDLTNPLFPPIVRGIEDALGEADYTVILANTDNDEDKERTVLHALLSRSIDGLILATAQREASAAIREMVDDGLPIVLVNRTMDDPVVSSVTADDRGGIQLAVEHLLALGHRRIAHIAGPQHVSTGIARYHSFVEVMRQLELDEDLVAYADWFREEAGADAFRALLERRSDITAVVAANDLIALGCYDVLNERGLGVGTEVSIVGFNDMLFADKLCPPLTTIRIPHYELGTRAAQIMLEFVQGQRTDPVQVHLDAELVERRSTGPPPSCRRRHDLGCGRCRRRPQQPDRHCVSCPSRPAVPGARSARHDRRRHGHRGADPAGLPPRLVLDRTQPAPVEPDATRERAAARRARAGVPASRPCRARTARRWHVADRVARHRRHLRGVREVLGGRRP